MICSICGHDIACHGDRAVAACDGGVGFVQSFKFGSRPPVCDCPGFRSTAHIPALVDNLEKVTRMSAPNVVGLDLSLTGTGIATPRGVQLVESKGAKAATLAERRERLAALAYRITNECDIVRADLVVIEQPAFSRTQGSQHDRSGLWWLVVDIIIGALSMPVAEVTPSGRAKYATGKGNASKDMVLAEVIRRFPEYQGNNNNTADSYVLMAMGLDHLGCPLVEMPKTHRAALDAVRWPLVSA